MSMLDAEPNDPAMDPATVLEEAADLLLIRGRGQGSDQMREPGTHCVLSAIAAVKGTTAGDYLQDVPAWAIETEGPEARAVALHLGPQQWEGRPPRNIGERVWMWNDRTDDDFEVIDTLRLVAKDLRNEAVA